MSEPEVLRIATTHEQASQMWRSRLPGQRITVYLMGRVCKVYASTEYRTPEIYALWALVDRYTWEEEQWWLT